jgi:ribonuclease R
MLTEQQVLHYISRQPKHMAGFKQLVHDLALKGRDRRELQQLLREMTRRRMLFAIGKERWALPTSPGQAASPARTGSAHGGAGDLVAGRLRMHRDGYGFVLPDPGSLPARAAGKLEGDIFIPPPEIGNAMHGDHVLVEMGRIRHDGRAEGRIIRVMEREQETVVGIFHYGDRHNFVTPIDEKVAMEIIIPHGMEYPKREDEESAPTADDRDIRTGKSAHTRVAPPSSDRPIARSPGSPDRAGFARAGVASPDHQIPMGTKAPTPKHPDRQSPHRVLGAEAQRKRDWEDLEGVVVEAEIIQWPSATQSPRGRVTEILGHEDDFGVDVEMIIRKHHIPHVFPAEVLEEAQEISPVIPQKEIAQRRDFRDLPIVTIDGETARDFDDAVLVRRLNDGNYELQVHIADVAHYVEDGSAIDEEARQRGTSVYFPDRAVPMLPLELSTDICSLRPEVDRLVLSCIMEIDHQGEVAYYELSEGIIRSAQRMTYTDVNAAIEGNQPLRKKYGALAESFDLMYELAQVLNRKRVKRGSIDFDLPEPVIEFDDFGLMQSISPSERNWAHRLIEEFMLAANETVASHLEQRGVPSLYRIHEKPDAKRIYEFETIAAGFGYSLGVGALPIKRVQTRGDKRSHYGSGRRPPTVELPEEVHVTPRMYQKLVQKIIGKPEERVLSFLMLRSLKQARYSEVNDGHFALAAPTYTHFTSPIRRYPDLIIHRILKWVLRHGGTAAQGSYAASKPPVSDDPMSRFSDVPIKHETSSHHTAQRFRAPQSHEAASPWSKRAEKGSSARRRLAASPLPGPISEAELHEIAESSSQSERAAAEAERELLEWKKLKFMEQRVGEDFDSLIVSVTKFGFFVELTELFIEGLVPINSLTDDNYTYHENTRQIIGGRSRKTYSIGDRVRVLVDRIDHLQRKIQFAVLEEKPRRTEKRHKKRR